MTIQCERPGASARRPGPSPARTHGELLAALERERVRDPAALQAERGAPEPTEHLAGQFRPITPAEAASNRRRLVDAVRDTDARSIPLPALVAPTKRTPHQSARPARPALTSTT